jgi:hypothetical protein
LVVGFRFTLDFFADFFAVPVVLAFAEAFFLTAFFFATGFAAVAPAVARLECFARARGVFFGAASAGELSASEATSATSNATAVLRIIDRPPRMRLR